MQLCKKVFLKGLEQNSPSLIIVINICEEMGNPTARSTHKSSLGLLFSILSGQYTGRLFKKVMNSSIFRLYFKLNFNLNSA